MSMTLARPEQLDFDTVSLRDLEQIPWYELDDLPFGVVGMSGDGLVQVYNVTESRLAGIPASAVVKKPFFAVTAQCMNNFMVAQHFEDQERLDLSVDYVLTLRMRPTPVRLRLLKEPESPLQYVLILRLW